MGPNGNTGYAAFWFGLFMMAPDVACDPVTDQFLVVWFGIFVRIEPFGW